MSIVVDQLELGPIGTNTYLVRSSPSAAEAVVVDPSGDATTIQRALTAVGAHCTAILVTHGHFDHIVSLADLAEQTGAPVYAPAGDRMLIDEPAAFTPPGITVRGAAVDTWLDGGETVDLAGMSFAVTKAAGHSAGHLAYFSQGELFSGDVLFAGSVGRTDLPGADWDVLEASIASLLETYPPETIVHPGHGPETTLAAELAGNPFLGALRAARSER